MEYTRVYKEIDKAIKMGKHYIVNIGGAGSSKTYSTMQYLLNKLVNNQEELLNILVIRKTNAGVKASPYPIAIDLLSQMGVDIKCESDNIVCGKNRIYFSGLKTLESKYYTKAYNMIYIEEATEMSVLDFNRIISHPCNLLFISCNPVFNDKNYWIKDICKNVMAEVVHSTHKDNPFMSKEFHIYIEELAKIDRVLNSIYNLGIEQTK